MGRDAPTRERGRPARMPAVFNKRAAQRIPIAMPSTRPTLPGGPNGAQFPCDVAPVHPAGGNGVGWLCRD